MTAKPFEKFSIIIPPLILLIFGVLVFGIYSNTFKSPFILDDQPKIEDNSHIRLNKLSLNDIVNAGIKSSKSRPFAYMSFALNYYFHRYALFGYHIVNIGIHFLTGLFLYLFIKITLTLPTVRLNVKHSDLIAFFTAFIWLVHPLQTQSVTYIVQRMNSMASMLFIISFLFYVKGRLSESRSYKSGWFIASVVSWLISLGTKQITVTLPLLIFLYEWYFFQDLNEAWLKDKLKYILIIVVFIIIISLFYLGLNPIEKLQSIGDYSRKEFTLSQRVFTQFRVVLYYISLIVVPYPGRLNLDYDFPLSYSIFNPLTTIFSLFMIIGLIGLAIYLARKERIISFCILWYFGNLVVESSIIPLAIIFEHRTYLPSMLIFVIPVLLLYRYVRPQWFNIAILCAVLVIFSVWTYQRNKVWTDKVTLWRDCVKKSPNKARPHNNLGEALANLEKTDEAMSHYLKALQIKPDYPDALNNIGIAVGKKGKADEAIEYYFKALKINPDFPDALNNLGVALKRKGEANEAIKHFLRALKLKPDYASAHNNLGVALSEKGETQKAINHYLKALQIKPDDADAHNNLGISLTNKGEIDEAMKHYSKALSIKPDYVDAHNNLGLVLAKQGKTDEAIEHYNEILKIDPEYSKAYFNLGVAFGLQGRSDKAVHYYSKALQMDPGMEEAHNNLGVFLMQNGKTDAAIDHFQKALKIKPDYDDAKRNLKTIIALQKDIEQDIAKIQKELRNNPNDPEIHYVLGKLFDNKGELEKAAAQYQKAIDLQPEFPEALNALAVLYAKKKEYGRAIFIFKKMAALWPDYANTYYNIACMYSRQNKIENSIEWLKLAVKKGYKNWNLIKTDKDLENIRGSLYYNELIRGQP